MKNTTTSSAKTILVTGGAGKTGGRVAAKLTASGWPIRIGTRSGNPKFDWNDKSTWKNVLQDINAVYITFQPDLAIPGSEEIIQAFTEAAVASGVQKLVLLSGRGETEAQRCEEIVMKAGVDWTIVRASWFNQNFSESYLLEPILAGYVALPPAEIGEPFVDADDIADVAVAALTEEGHNGELYEVTGPRLLTFREAVSEIAKATGKPIHYEQVTMEQYTAALAENEVPADIVWLIKYLFTEVLDGRNAGLADGVQRALKRAPKDFSDYARETAASGAWG